MPLAIMGKVDSTGRSLTKYVNPVRHEVLEMRKRLSAIYFTKVHLQILNEDFHGTNANIIHSAK